jgi:hypothetical protein
LSEPTAGARKSTADVHGDGNHNPILPTLLDVQGHRFVCESSVSIASVVWVDILWGRFVSFHRPLVAIMFALVEISELLGICHLAHF